MRIPATQPQVLSGQPWSKGLKAASFSVLLVGLVGLGGCAETTLAVNTAKIATSTPTVHTNSGGYKVGRPYQIRGQWYTPKDNMAYNEEGVASWYGPGFHGKSTASGERFNQNAMTAAHPTLPLPTMVLVTNLDNGRSAELKINDRGPFAHDRIIDVSKRAAKVLGFLRSGTAHVRVTVLPEQTLALRNGQPVVSSVSLAAAPVPPPKREIQTHSQPILRSSMDQQAFMAPNVVRPQSASIGGSWYIQAGAFSNPQNASRAMSNLGSLAPTKLSPVTTDSGASLTRVRLGPVSDSLQAARLLQVVRSSGYPEAHLVSH